MDNRDLKIKSLKTNFRDSSELANPVVKALIGALNKQESYSPLLVEKFNNNGFEVISPSKQGRFWYEACAKSPTATSLAGIGIISSVALWPVYAIPLIALGVSSSAYTYYHLAYFKSNLDAGYRTLQLSKKDIASFLKSLIALKKQLDEFPDELIPVDLKGKNIRKLIADLVQLIAYSIYLNIQKSSDIKIKDAVSVLEKIKDLYSSGSHPEMYFYDTLSKSRTTKKDTANKEEHQETLLDLGDKPEFSVKADAISEGIRMAKRLAEQGPKKKRSSKKKRDSNSPGTHTEEGSSQKPVSQSKPAEKEAKVQSTGDILDLDRKRSESDETKPKAQEDSSVKDKTKTEGGLVSPGDSMRTNEPITDVHDEEDEKFLEALNERDDLNMLDQMDDDDDQLPDPQIDEVDLDDGYDKLLGELESEESEAK